MKFNFEIKEFDKQTLSDLLETANYANSAYFDYDLTPEAKKVAEGEFYCEKAADALLKGEAIWIYDNSCYEDGYSKDDDLPFYGTKGVNWLRTFKHKLEYDAYDGSSVTCYVPGYRVTLETLIKGFNASTDEYKCEVANTIFIKDNFDRNDAYNFFQIAVFGEIIYG